MAVSVLDLFKVGIGPSSSHTVGPMRAARLFAEKLRALDLLGSTRTIRAELFGSLGATGKGHGSDKAILLGLEGEMPESVDVAAIDARLAAIRADGRLRVLGSHPIEFREADHLVLHRRRSLPFHPNGMQFTALDGSNGTLVVAVYYSVGGGFVVADGDAQAGPLKPDPARVALPFSSAAELLDRCTEHALPVSGVMAENEKAFRAPAATRDALLAIWHVMQDCVVRGCTTPGTLPGGFKVRRRAPELHRQLEQAKQAAPGDPLATLDWISLYAIAVNEENAAGGRVVTAPTNGAAGIIPAVLHYYARYCPGADHDGVVRFLLVAGAIGLLYKENASLSGADVGCQGEVGVACSMAAAALAEVTGGTPLQVENAAEIAMEHHLGLTCDPVGGLVQIPCIERNAVAAVKAVSAARLAMLGDGRHYVSLDKVIKTMRETGADMKTKYKETARGGLALNIVEVPVSLPQC